MPIKKKVAPKKAIKPVKKPVVKQVTPTKKPARKTVVKAKPTAKKVVVKVKPVVKKSIKKVAVKVKPVAKKAVVKTKKVIKKVVVKPIAKGTPKKAIKPVVKKEPAKVAKVIIPKIATKASKKYEPDFMRSILDKSEAVVSGPTQRYSDSELLEFKELIQLRLERAKKELSYLQGLITRKDETGDMDEGRYMTMEDGSVSMEREQLSQMASRQITYIDHLEKAMMRIENKTYGICRKTGKLIEKARLRAVPHATLTVEAKQSNNK